MMSQELVPQTYHRAAWNMYRYGETNLPGQSGLFLSADVERLNTYARVVVGLGRHGLVPPEEKLLDDPLDYDQKTRLSLPIQAEYQATAAVVEPLDAERGDVLFTEGFGFTTPIILWASSGEPSPELASKLVRYRAVVERKRAMHHYTSWGYGARIALSNRVPLVAADFDAFDKERAIAIGRNGPTDLGLQRVRCARNIMIGWASRHLPLLGAPVPQDADKPTYLLLFGSGHNAQPTPLVAGEDSKDTLQISEAFGEAGITIIPHNIYESTIEERKAYWRECRQLRTARRRRERANHTEVAA